ncbi:MAG: hypothetical protein IT371_00325 [Deltaproteobacteria bacterium]|nr:hypothetical protein [Deltaproteobacteria bacterium]
MRSYGAYGLLLVGLALSRGALAGVDGGAASSQPTSAPTNDPAGAPTSEPTSEPASQPAGDAGVVLPAWAPKLTARVEPAVVRLGDPVRVTIVVRQPKGVTVTLPLRLELGDFTELSRKETQRELPPSGGLPEVEQTFALEVAAYNLGEVTLPPIEVNALGPKGEILSLKTEALPIRVRSGMGNEPNPKLKGLEPPVQVFQRNWWLIGGLIALGAALVVALLTLLVARYVRARRERHRPPPPPIPAERTALAALAALDVEAYLARDAHKELYLRFSEILRAYVGARWGFDALEMTTTEIAEWLARRRVKSGTEQKLLSYFTECDLVKFAKHRPEVEVARAAKAEAETIVRETTPVMASPPEAPHAPQ